MENVENRSPFFSIVIPVYNRMKLLQETILSIRNQTFTSYEIIVVDDGSTDGSGAEMDRIYGNEKDITLIHQVNMERGASRNNGFRKAAGEYVIFLDSDDRILPEHLQVLHEKITALGEVDYIATHYDFLRDGKRVKSIISKYPEGYYDYKFFLNGNALGANVCVRRKNSRLRLFEEDRKYSIKEDWLFFLENLQDQSLYLIDRVTLYMLDHDDRSMRQDDKLLIQKTILTREWILGHVKLSKAEQRQLEAHINYFCAIHSYLDNDRKRALNFIFNAIRSGGIKSKYFILLAKIIAGRNTMIKAGTWLGK